MHDNMYQPLIKCAELCDFVNFMTSRLSGFERTTLVIDVAYGIGAIKRNVKNECFAWVTFLKKIYDTVIRVLS
jgi:hypothetical protein